MARISRYARVLSHYPYVVMLVVLVVVSTCLVVTLTMGHGINFEDPLAGFEPRGTELSDRLITFENLLDNVGEEANLLPFGAQILQPPSEGQLLMPQQQLKTVVDRPASSNPAPAPPEMLRRIGRAPLQEPSPPPSPPDISPLSSSSGVVALSSAESQKKKRFPLEGQEKRKGLAPLGSKRVKSSVEKAKRRNRGNRDRAYRKWSKRRKEFKKKRRRKGGSKREQLEASAKLSISMQSDGPGRDTNETGLKPPPFCTVPDKIYSRLVVTSARGRSLFNQDDLLAMCHLEAAYFRSWPNYGNVCIRDKPYDGQCCRAWSLANYVALLAGRKTCEDVTRDDVTLVHALLSQCAPFYYNFTLIPNCAGRHTRGEWFYSSHHLAPPCRGVPEPCRRFNAVYHILHFLSDTGFMYQGTTSSVPTSGHAISMGSESFLKLSTIFLPVVAGAQAVNLFDHLDSLPRTTRGVSIVGAHFGVKYSLFERYLFADSVWIGLACAVIFLGMWLYTSSLFVTLMAFLSMFWAVEVAYFIYTFVFKIKFFPYMNMVTLIVMVGVGADDLFIYCKVWHLAKAEKNNGVLEKIVSDTLRHTALSMLVTSFTSAAAFYANYVSDITSIRCFSIFAGTCIVINFILTVTWLPASIMLHEKWLRCCVGLSDRRLGSGGAISACSCVSALPYKVYFLVCDWSRIFFEKLLPCLVIKFRFMWIVVFGSLWVASVFVIFYYPRLKLPNTRKFQVFSSDHLSERYDFEFEDSFDFERMEVRDEVPMFPITVVWGVSPTDTGDPLDPYNKGSLTFDPEFDLTSPSAQRWILEFCARLRHTDFYVNIPGIQLTDCFLENFVYRWMKQPCNAENTECCNQTSFPFQKAVLMRCLADYIPEVRKTPSVYYGSHTPGPRFSNGRITAFFVQFLSNRTFSHSYREVEDFYIHVNGWVEKEMRRAPPEMGRGWFVSHLHFYDLQSSLAMGTPLALGVSLVVVAIVGFFTTLNVLVSLYALLAVGGAISSTLAALVLLGWTLDVLESVVITVAVGLAVDVTLHYGVAFRLAPDTGREMRVVRSLGRMGSPVSMASATTMLAGAFMMPSTVLAYRKFGTFLLLLVSLAWLYATFFFQALLRVAGPDGGFGQFRWPASDCCSSGGSRERVDKTVYSMSESTLSSSSTSTREHSHGHSYVYTQELEPLNGSRERDRDVGRERERDRGRDRDRHKTRDRSGGDYHASRHCCHKHHPATACTTSSHDSCSGSSCYSDNVEKKRSPHRLRPHGRHHHHNHHHHHNNHQHRHHVRPRLKTDYVPVCTSADVIPTSDKQQKEENIPCVRTTPANPLLPDDNENCTTPLASASSPHPSKDTPINCTTNHAPHKPLPPNDTNGLTPLTPITTSTVFDSGAVLDKAPESPPPSTAKAQMEQLISNAQTESYLTYRSPLTEIIAAPDSLVT